MTAPDRIWCHPTERQPVPAKDKKHAKWMRGNWKDHDSGAHGDVEYVRLDPAVLAALPEVRALIEEAVWAVAQVADKELEKWGFASGPDGFGRRAEMRNAIAEELPSVKTMRIETAKAKGPTNE